MKRKLFTLMLILCLVAGLSLTAYASSNHLVDNAGLLTDTEAANLEAKLSQISDRHNVDIVIVAVDSTDGKSPMDFADDYYDYIGYGIFLTGPIPRVSPEDCGGEFFHDEACTLKGNVPEELALLSTTGVLVTGCCHAGIINTLFHCHKILPELPVQTIVGGLHLKNATPSRLDQTANILKQFKVKNLYLMHCTGEKAVGYLKERLPECNIYIPALGETFTV